MNLALFLESAKTSEAKDVVGRARAADVDPEAKGLRHLMEAEAQRCRPLLGASYDARTLFSPVI